MNTYATLVPLDGSEAAEAVLPYAETLAGLLGTRLKLLRVVEPLDDAPWGLTQTVRQRGKERQRSVAERYLDAVKCGCRDRGIDTEAEVRVGEPAECILDAAMEKVDLIAMSTHGRGGMQRWMLGSVADRVLRLGSLPTLLVRVAEPAEKRGQISLRRIVVPLDGSQLAECALQLACRLAKAAGATLVLARAEEHIWQMPAGLGAIPHLGQLDDEVTQAITSYLEKIKRRLPASIRIECAACRGYAAELLEGMTLNGNVDLVVMTTHGRGGLRRLVIGSMAERLVRLGGPTLLVRSSAGQQARTQTDNAETSSPDRARRP